MMYYVHIAALLLLIVPSACFDVNPLPAGQRWHYPHDHKIFNITEATSSSSYKAIISAVYSFATHGSTNKERGLVVLSKQTGGAKPDRWLMLELRGDGRDQIMLAIRKDNLYISAFADRTGKWYVFQNIANPIPGATILTFEDGYRGLMNGYINIESLRLGKETTLRALRELTLYKHSLVADSGCVSRAVAIMAVTVSEATRFKRIQEEIEPKWSSGGGKIKKPKLVVSWTDMSCAVLVTRQKKGVYQDKSPEAIKLKDDFDMTSVDQVVGNLSILIWPKNNKCLSGAISWPRP